VILKPFRVSEASLSPDYQDGDYVLVSSLPYWVGAIRPGDVVVFRRPTGGVMIKIVERLENEGRSLFVTGRSADSMDSRTFGAVPREAVLGKVIWRISRKAA
jgi:signal peptidase I